MVVKLIIGLVGLFFGILGTPKVMAMLLGDAESSGIVLPIWAAGWTLAAWGLFL